ncbi:MAG: ferredoxin family protein [Methanobrevibacter sp.]|jgi:2-oxoglutarate ferredoxin oxidoreductase subunit delta|nr:ferredoxin family protein [Candidatus Methanoflexus mossambicus]
MIKIDHNFCKGCDICIESCPKGVYEKADVFNEKDVQVPMPVNIDKCIKCHLCEMMCPDQATFVED